MESSSVFATTYQLLGFFYEGAPYTTWVFWAHFKKENLFGLFLIQ
jgi:hypothetical protein